MNKVYKRSLFNEILFFIVCLGVFIPDAKLLKVILSEKKVDSLVIIMFAVCLVLTIIFLLAFILECIRKKDAIKVTDENIVIQEFKRTVVPIANVKEIKYRNAYAGFLGAMSSGDLFITTKDDKRIRVKDLRNVKNVCSELTKLINKD